MAVPRARAHRRPMSRGRRPGLFTGDLLQVAMRGARRRCLEKVARRSATDLATVLVTAAACAVAAGAFAVEPAGSCLVDVGRALDRQAELKTTDVTPLAEGTWIGDVYVLPYSYPEPYDRHLSGGGDNVEARQWVAQSFFAHNPDAYDFLAVVTSFVFDAGWGQHGDPIHGLYWGVKNDVSGIGLGLFDHSQSFGSGRLQGVIDANGLDLVRDPNGDLDQSRLLTILNHELGHRWLAHCRFVDSQGVVSGALQGVDDGHWSYLLDSDASYMYGADWRDNGDGSFTAVGIKQRYSDLDLYLMGMLAPDEVGLVTLIDNPAIAPDQYPELGATVTGAPETVALDQVIAAEGPRQPSFADAPHELRIAVVYLAAPGAQITAEELDFLAAARGDWARGFFAQTGGRAVLGVGRNSLPPANPGSLDLAAAVDWLLSRADQDGLWQDHPTTRHRDSAAAVEALAAHGGHGGELAVALDALAGEGGAPTEIEARRAAILARFGHPAAAGLLDELASWVLDEGAWGGGLRYAADTATTALVARALAAGGRQQEAELALDWIGDRQHSDGGWSWRAGGPGAASPTLESIVAAVAVDPERWNQAAVQSAVSWLLARRSQGGFGEPHPDIVQTASFLIAARGQALSQQILDDAVGFIADRQRSDGSWGGRVFDTATAIAALAPLVLPDLSVSPAELIVEPGEPFPDDQLTLTAAVHGGGSDVPAGVGYRWEVLDAGHSVVATLDGMLPLIPASLFATVTDSWDLRYQVSPGDYVFRFTVDPDGQLAETDESNNSAELPVTFRDHTSWIDLVLSADRVTASPGAVARVPETVVIDGVVRNTGWAEARGAVLAVFELGLAAALDTTSVTVPPDGEAPFRLTVELAEARPYQLEIAADPDDLLNDVDPTNNRVVVELGLASTFDPALVAGSLAADPASGVAGDPVMLSFDVVNHGTEPVSGLQAGVTATSGDPPVATPVRLLDLDPALAPGEARTVDLEWRPPTADPGWLVAVEVDPNHLVSDADRSNNAAEISVPVAPSPLPNLVASHTVVSFDPAPALQHQPVHITAGVANLSDNDCGAFTVRLRLDEAGTGPLIAEAVLPGLAAGSSTVVEADWTVDEMADRLVWLEVDTGNEVAEFNEDDNVDFRVLDVETLPDLVVTAGQVTVDPRFPHSGQVVEVDATVLNAGDQPAGAHEVELVVDGVVVGTATVAGIAGGSIAEVGFDWPTAGVAGAATLVVVADGSDAIVELDEGNNAAELSVMVQDDDLWVTERFISPDGNGVRDATEIFVRDPVDAVEVVDPWGERIRIIEVDPSGHAVWDGRNDTGGTVRDGVYELRAGGLTTWVEVDVNNVAITDDVRQPLIIGQVSTTSNHPGARFTSLTPSPADGVAYLTERLDYSQRKLWRWDGARLGEVPGWPDGHWTIHQLSADDQVFITWNGAYSLIRYPGPSVDPLPPPTGSVDRPHLSPDGRWILWVDSRTSQPEKLVVLQQTDDLNEIVELGPFPHGSSISPPTVHWAPGGSRAVVAIHRLASISAVDVELGSTPSAELRELDVQCRSGAPYPTSTVVDFDAGELICTHDPLRLLRVVDLMAGQVVEEFELPDLYPDTEVWYRLTNAGRAVEVDFFFFDDAPDSSIHGGPDDDPLLYDWRRGHGEPWFGGFIKPIPWSAHDRWVYSPWISGTGAVFTHRSPAANLAVDLEPVVRFGGAGVDLYLTVTDRNLDSFTLELAPASDPDAFEPLGQPSRERFLGQSWGTWIPPSAGVWRLRLTARDLAGNQRSATEWVTWNGVSDIAGLWTEARHVSPVSSPGVNDELVWHYTVLRPAQLLFEIVDGDGGVIRSLPVGAGAPGAASTTWDGLDDAGRPVPDGDYRLVFRGAEWPVTVDNTPPEITFDIGATTMRPTDAEIATAAGWDPPVDLVRSALFNPVDWSVNDDNLDSSKFEGRHVDTAEWVPTAALAADMRAEWWSERVVRQVAVDLAGNRSTAERLHRDERLGLAIAEPPCRSADEPCLFPDRPDINELRDADGLMAGDVAVLWPHYSTLLVQSTVWGGWRDTLRLDFRVPAEGGAPPGDWQPGTLLLADTVVWRRVTVPTGDSTIRTERIDARALPIYWEHPGLPMRPYEVRIAAVNRDGTEITSPITTVVPRAPLAVEHLGVDSGGDLFRVHNISTVRIDEIELQTSDNGSTWRFPGVEAGALDPGMAMLVNVGCRIHGDAVDGHATNWVRVVGVDPAGAEQVSLSASFERDGPAAAVSRPSFTLIRGTCASGSPDPIGMIGYSQGQSRPAECTTWSCGLGWFTPGSLVDLQVTVPGTDPTGAAVAGYELLLDGAVIAGSPELNPGTAGRVMLDLSGVAEGDHVVSERYSFAPGEQGLLSACVQSATLHVDRAASVTVTSPTDGQSLCPDQGGFSIVWSTGETTWSEGFLVDGSPTGVSAVGEILVSRLTPGIHTLEAEVVDLAGNAACASVEFVSEAVAAVDELTIEPSVFSPTNTLGRPTQTVISFTSTATADFVAEIRDGFDDAVTSAGGRIAAGETLSFSWDGRDDGGLVVADGSYELWIRLVSDCGAVYETPPDLYRVTVDTTGPEIALVRPSPGAWILGNLEIQGRVFDPRFESWEARLSTDPPGPGTWQVIASGDRPTTDPSSVLARWSAGHLAPGPYVFVLDAVDEPGNPSSTGELDLTVEEPELIASYHSDPIYVSPNGDGAVDSTDFRFELYEQAMVTITDEFLVLLVDNQLFQPGLVHTVSWDGIGADGTPVPDGAYTLTLSADATGSPLWEEQSTTVVVDRIAPSVVIASPADGEPTALPVTVSGFTDDPHADHHAITLIAPDGAELELAAGPGDWLDHEILTLDDLPDGEYRIRVEATDLASNETVVEHVLVVDATAPSAAITAPAAGAVVDPVAQPFVLRGTITAGHPQSVAWWIAQGSSPAPADFVLVHEEPVINDGDVQYTWTGPPPVDGTHTLRLSVLDQIGRTAEDRRLVAVDSASPEVEITNPVPGAVVTGPTAISGLVDDANLEHWTLEAIGPGGGTQIIAAGVNPAAGELITWTPPEVNGPATLRLEAVDAAGHASETSVSIDVAVTPPGAPVDVVAEVVNGRDVALSWQPGPGPSPVGYHVERNGAVVTASPVAQPSWNDLQLLDGVYSYRVVAVGPWGRTSDPSAPATAVVNVTPPDVALTAPTAGARIGPEVEIYGTAFAADDFAFWEVAARPAGGSWITLGGAEAPVIGGFLVAWLTQIAPWSDGPHELRLAAEDTFGNRAERVLSVEVDTAPPDPGPSNLQATLVALEPDGLLNDVELTWVLTPTPPDLAGVYLYRNGMLANAGGTVIGDPTPYLLTGTSYTDRDLPDGDYTYGATAADVAGNASAVSNPAGPVTVDVRRPHAVLTAPAHLSEIEGPVEVISVCDDDDVVTLDLQFRRVPDPGWSAIAPTFNSPPYVALFSPSEHGVYEIRAIAADAGGPDPAPHVIQVTAADLPPAAPLQVTARVAGGDVALTWIAPPDPAGDLAGFDIMQNGVSVTPELLPQDTLVWVDGGLADGTYEYRVVAVDDGDQRGSSDPAPALVLTPFWAWTEGVRPVELVDIAAGDAHPLGEVAIDRFTPAGGLQTVATVDADSSGAFGLDDAALEPGVNSFTAVSRDPEGNTSRRSLPLLVVLHDEPEPPDSVSAAPAGGDVTLSWSAAPDPDDAGFAVSRDGVVINETGTPRVFDPAFDVVGAGSGDPADWLVVVDGDPATGWTPDRVPTAGMPEWWSWTWPEAVEVARIAVGWSTTDPPQRFDVDVLTAGGWLWSATLPWDGQPTMTVPVGVTATGVRIRLPESGWCGGLSCLPELTEVGVEIGSRTTGSSFTDTGLPDGVYSYEIRRHNTWGQVSPPAAVAVAVGPEQPAAPTGLTVTPVDCAGLALDWQAASGQPGTPVGHRVYRSEHPGGPSELIAATGPTQVSAGDPGAPVGATRFYVVTSLVGMSGVVIESAPSAQAAGTASCVSPPPPVITHPTTVGQPITIAPSQTPIWIRGNAVAGSTVTLLHDGAPVAEEVVGSVFMFFGIQVHAGSNFFAARQQLHDTVVDSAAIEVILDPSLVPDLDLVAADVTPEAAAPGELVMAEATVELAGPVGETVVFEVALTVTDPLGATSEAYRTTLELVSGETATVRAPWTAELPSGLYRWTWSADPDDALVEIDETNNAASVDARVLAGDGLSLDVSTGSSSYLVGQQLTGEVAFASADPAADYVLETRLEDAGGRVVAVLDVRTLPDFGRDWITVGLDHPLIGLYPGLYRVRALAAIGGVTAVEAMSPFELVEPLYLAAEVATDRTSYPEGSPVVVSGTIRNIGPAFVDGLVASTTIVDESSGLAVGHSVIEGIAITAGGQSELSWTWLSAGAVPGPYRAALAVQDDTGRPLAAAEPFGFTVVPGDVRLAGGIELSAGPVEPGDPVTASVTVANTGPADLTSVEVTVRLIDPVALEVVDEHFEITDLDAGASHAFAYPLTTDGLELRRHVAVVSAAGAGGAGPFAVDLASAGLEIADLTPPVVVVVEPSGGGVACEAITVSAEVEDALSRVERVFHHLDDEPTAVPLHPADPAVNPSLYSVTRALPPGLDGPHQVTVIAEDAAGNASGDETVSFDTDTAPPSLEVTGPADGSCNPGGVSFVFTATDSHLVSLVATVDGEPYASGSPIAVDGSHLFQVTAADACGREAGELRSFVIDSTPPEIVVDGVTNGGQVILGAVLEWAALDANLAAATATLDGIEIGPSVTLDVPGPHTLHVTAVDCAANHAEITVDFTVTEAVLALAGSAIATPGLLEPGQPLTVDAEVTNAGTDLEASELILEVVHLPSSTVAAVSSEIVDLTSGQTHSLSIEHDTTGWDLGAHEVRWAARGLFLGQPFDIELATAAVVLADLTAPTLGLVAPAPGLACDEIVVVVEADDVLTGVSAAAVSVDAGAPQPLTWIGGATWSASLALTDGAHHLEVTATDGAGNTAGPLAVDVDLDTEAPVLTVTAPDDGGCVGQPVTVEFSADDAHLDTLTAMLNGAAVVSGHSIEDDGAYQLDVVALDLCGREITDARQFTVDTADPVVAIDGLTDGSTVVVGVAGEWSAHDENLTASAALLDGQPVDPSFIVATVGGHHLEVSAEDCAGNSAGLEIDFATVSPEDGLGAVLTAAPAQVEPPQLVAVTSTVENLTDTVYGNLTVRLDLVETAAGGVVASHEIVVDLDAGAAVDLDHSFATDGLHLGAHRVTLTAEGEVHGAGFTADLAGADVEVVDRTPPAVTVLSPEPGLACDAVELRADVTDGLSGVDLVRARVDGDQQAVPLVHVGGDLWAASIELADGPHHIEVDAVDGAGNGSDPQAVDVDLDLTAPVLTVDAPNDGHCGSEAVTITFSADDAHLDSLWAVLDGAPLSSGTAVGAEGDHHLAVGAADACGSFDTFTTDFVIDATAPRITVAGVAAGDELPPPVTIEWSVDDPHLVETSAVLDGQTADSGVVVDRPGPHTLIVEAADCAANHASVEISFIVTDEPGSGLEITPPVLGAGGRVLLLDRSTAGGQLLEQWLVDLGVRVERVTDGCAFVTELRRARHDLVVLYGPHGSAPLDLAGCSDDADLASLALELSASVYRFGGTLVLGDGMAGPGCLGCLIDAAGTDFGDDRIALVEVDATTTIIDTDGGLTLGDVRPLGLDGAFPLLVDGAGGAPECDGLRSVTVELALPPDVPRAVEVAAATPHEALDTELGEIGVGDRLDGSNHPWVDVAVTGLPEGLAIEVRSARGGSLPDWLAIDATVTTTGPDPLLLAHTGAWLPTVCGLAPGRLVGELLVTAVESVGHGVDDTVAATGRRYGRGESIVLPWDAAAPVNADALSSVEQALGFTRPSEPRPVVAGLPVPLSFTVTNNGTAAAAIRITAGVPPELLLEAWDDPVSLDPVVWELDLPARGSAAPTVWLTPFDPSTIELSYSIAVAHDGGWTVLDDGTVLVTAADGDRARALSELRMALDGCARTAGDPAVSAVLRDVLAAADGVAAAGDDQRAAARAITDLVRAFAAAEPEHHPCLAEVRQRLADLVALWQARWVNTGSTSW